jgi:hypothetical protein
MRAKLISLVVTLGLLLLMTGSGLAESPPKRSIASDVGLGLGAVALSLFYSPAKILYSALGGTIGGLAYLVTIGNSEVALGIIEPACRGDYIITPAILTGKEKLEFIGSRRRASRLRRR